MAQVNISSPPTRLNDGILQLQNGVAMDGTLRFVTDQNNTASTLKLSTTLAQFVSQLRITTNDSTYLDVEDGSGNNRFTISRDPSSQQVNVDFASNPTGSTTNVGAIRTYVDGTNLSEVMTFREDGRLTIYNTLKSIYDNYSDLGTNTERFANLYSLTGRFTNVSTNNLGPNGAATWITISSSVFALVGGQLNVKGQGSTSATTSLLVQNSSGNNAFEVKDDRTANFQGRIQIEYDKISFLGSPSNTYIQQSLGIGYGYYSAAISNQIMINAQPKIIVKDTGASRASTLIVGHSVATSDAADASALLEVRSDATYLKGFLPPRMTTAEKNAITTPAAGLMVYDTTLNKLCVRTAAAWETITSI